MAQITVLKRVTGKAHLTSADEANDQLAISGLVRTAAGTATLYADGNTTAITVGASGTPTTIADNLTINGELRGPSDGTGIIIGQPGAGANTGSAAQLQSFSTTQRNNLTPSDGMLIYNTSALTLQVRNNGSWVDVPGTDGGDSQAVQPGIVSLGSLLDYPSSGGTSSSEIQYARVFLTAGVTYDRMRFFQESGGSGARNVNIGIYDQSSPMSTTGVPNSRVAQTGTTVTSAANNGTFVTINLTSAYSVTTTGYYWLSFIPDSANLKFAVSLSYRGSFLPVRRQSGTGTTLPATAGSLTNPSSAVVWIGLLKQ